MFEAMLTTADIEQMTVPERWSTIELLWQSIIGSDSEVPSPQWHEEIIKGRVAEAESGVAKFLSLDELRDQLRIPQA